jgi:hypothetical protein
MTTLVSFLLGAVILGLGQWLYVATRALMARRRRRLGRRLNVTVLVDRRNKTRRRACFWPDLLKSPKFDLRLRAKVQLFSIADELDRHRNPATRLFSTRRTDVIVVNWDNINGDPVYGSERSLEFLRHYRPDMLHWLYNGGLLLVESQGVSWGTVQDPYDCFTAMFDDSYVGTCSTRWTVGRSVTVHPKHGSNLLARDLGPDDLQLSRGGLWARRSWFPRKFNSDEIESLRYARRHQEHMFRGWFDNWSADWRPLFQPCVAPQPAVSEDQPTPSPDTDRAVALYRPVKRPTSKSESSPDTGAIILTTMFVASSELHHFVSNFLSVGDHAYTS